MKCYSENCKGGRTHLQLCAVFINAAKRMPSLCKMNCQYLQYPLIRYKTLSVQVPLIPDIQNKQMGERNSYLFTATTPRASMTKQQPWGGCTQPSVTHTPAHASTRR